MTENGRGAGDDRFFQDNEHKRIEGRGGVEGAEDRHLASCEGVLMTTKS